MTTITKQVLNAVTMNVSATLVREELCTPKQAIATAVVFADNLDRLVGSTTNWVQKMYDGMNEVLVDGELTNSYPVIDALEEVGFIDNLLDSGVYVAGEHTLKIVDEVRSSYAPALASVGVERRRDYASITTSPLFKEAIHALESTEFMKSDEMLDIAYNVYEAMPNDNKLKAQEYVILGSMQLETGEAYVSEFFGDKRGRMYQAACYGPNGQSSDMARAMMDLHGVSQDYDSEEVMKLLIAEMKDMGSWVDKPQFISDMNDAVVSPVKFICEHLNGDYHMSKPWNFVKFAKLVYKVKQGNNPYIGVAVGLDAKCSGPQLAALMVGDEKMLAATGFTTKQVDDAYHNALACVRSEGITGLNRSLIKKSFMAIFYGAGQAAMMDAETITQATWECLYSGLTNEQIEEKSKLFYQGILKSFGVKLNNIRAKIKQGGFDFELKLPKFDKPVRHFMPDGLEVAMEYKEKLNMDGEVITQEVTASGTTTVIAGMETKRFDNMNFATKNYNHADFARTGFVNMIQATDAMIARLIVVHAKRLGAQHIIAVHDCFRVNIHDMPILDQAIKNAYLDLFGTKTDASTKDLPLGTDIIGMYFDGAREATIDSLKINAEYASQFYGKSDIRRLDEVNGADMRTLINKLGETTYFSK